MIGVCIFVMAAAIAGGVIYATNRDWGKTHKVFEESKEKKQIKSKQLLALKNPRIAKSLFDGANNVDGTFDFTTYNDRALVYWDNTAASAKNAIPFAIWGNPIYRLGGATGYLFEYSDYSDIDANGEKEAKVSNNFIASQAQCEDIGDFLRKELSHHDMYSVTLFGCHPYFEVGDLYTLQIEHQLPSIASQVELIDVAVEIRGVSIQRSVGQLGRTIVSLRVPSGEWNKTTSVRARKIMQGLPYDALNRGNEITIGASDYTGQATYYCTGTDDDIVIQKAIDELSEAGGGEVHLYAGTFDVRSTVYNKIGVVLSGDGDATIIYNKQAPLENIIRNDSGKCIVKSLCIEFSTLSDHFPVGIIYDTTNTMGIENVTIKNAILYNTVNTHNYIINGVASATSCEITGIGCSGPSCFLYMYANIGKMSNCIVTDSYIQGVINLIGHYQCNNISSCKITNISGTLTNQQYTFMGFYLCKNIASSSVTDNAITTTDINSPLWGYYTCENLVGCEYYNNSSTFLEGFELCDGLSACSSSSNTAARTYWGFIGCKNIAACRSITNTGTVNESGFSYCNSMQQCKSDDTTKYYNSFSDAGFANACADTAAGGYNS